MPPILVKTCSAFISNGFGRFISTSANDEMTRGKFHSWKRLTLSWNTAALLVYNCCLLHIFVTKLAILNRTLTAAFRLVVGARIVAINTPLFVELRADRALGELEYSIQ
jgi:hypothetical protein